MKKRCLTVLALLAILLTALSGQAAAGVTMEDEILYSYNPQGLNGISVKQILNGDNQNYAAGTLYLLVYASADADAYTLGTVMLNYQIPDQLQAFGSINEVSETQYFPSIALEQFWITVVLVYDDGGDGVALDVFTFTVSQIARDNYVQTLAREADGTQSYNSQYTGGSSSSDDSSSGCFIHHLAPEPGIKR